MSPAPRLRRDPRDPGSMRARVPAAAASPTAPVRVDDAAPFVLAVVDLDAGRLSRDDRDLMGAARRLADELGGGVVLAACLPPGVELRAEPDREGADRVAIVADIAFADDLAEPRVPAVLAAAEACRARHILFSDTPLGGELARRVAARLGDRAAFDVRRLEAGGLDATIDGGQADVRRPLPRVIVPARSTFAPAEGSPSREARALEVRAGRAEPRVRVLGVLPLDPASVSLTEADLVIGAGSGVTDWRSFHEAARALGAAEAGSRVVCDAGLLPRGRQVGASGLLIEPRCYLAFGIAGASQHLQGIAGAKRVIAVNTDLRAEMTRRADLAIVADAQAVLPALVSRMDRRGPRGAAPTAAEPPVAAHPSAGPEGRSEGPSGFSWARSRKPASLHAKIDDVVALVSMGRHPVSRRRRRAELDARALELGLGCGSAVMALHAGPAEAGAAVLRDHVGAGATGLVVLDIPAETDPVPALEAWLRQAGPRLIVAGSRAEAGECSGMVPFLLAERLGYALARDIVGVDLVGETARLVQALAGGRRRRLEAPLPLIIAVGRSGPEPRLSARMRAARGTVQLRADARAPADERTTWSTRPSRPRPKRLAAPPGPGQTAAAEAGRREMIDPDPGDAADAILAFLAREGLMTTVPDDEARP